MQALASSEALQNFMDACAGLTTETQYKSQGKGSNRQIAMPLAIAVTSLIRGNESLAGLGFCPT